MNPISSIPALLLLEDGTVFYGRSAGKIGTTTGEICFNTGMTGYQEIYTDPSYSGQILVHTAAHIGNYGIEQDEFESRHIQISGLVCKNFSPTFSRKLASGSLQSYAVDQNLVAIYDIDTRALVKHIRNKGAMNALISSEEIPMEGLLEILRNIPSMEGLELASGVSTPEAYIMGNESAEFRVAVLDLGAKKSIMTNLTDRDCLVKVFPAKTSYQEMKAWNPHGFMISNGPGDPAPVDFAIRAVKSILENHDPLFGICLGQQILALALGIPTFKMHHGHRGANHPVKNLMTDRCEITTQNHGFSVDPEAIKASSEVEITHINLNDQTIEGFRVLNKPAFAVQYHPEASPGPHDARYLFDNFIQNLHSYKETPIL
jgi:carbamoyl-phosphate synthase small subunit